MVRRRRLLVNALSAHFLMVLMFSIVLLTSLSSGVALAATDRPRLQVASYTVVPKIASAGKPFELTITIENVGDRDAHDIDVTLANVEGQPTLQFFSPLDRGSYFFIDKLVEGKSKDETIRMTTNDKIESGSYNLVLNFAYESSGGTAYQNTEIIGVTVLREPIIKIEGLKYPTRIEPPKTDAEADQPKVAGNIVNASDFVVNAVSVSLAGDLKVKESNYYIGNLEGGGFDTYETEIEDLKPGTYKEKLTVTYRNDFGEEKKVAREFTVKIKGEAVEQAKPEGFWATIVNFFKALFGLGT